jgi:hypothetical protein
MKIPVKALKENDLTKIKRIGSEESSHEMWQVRFTEHGVSKIGYFKKLEPDTHFPELLAKFSVVTAGFKNSFQGARSATEYLVFNEEEKICGIVSHEIKDFKPFNFAGEPEPSDPSERELVIPSKKTLLKHKTIKTYFVRLFLDDDDPHPHNVGLQGDLDFDMFWRRVTMYMKGGRPGIALPKKRIGLSIYDYENCPCIEDAGLYHWCAYDHPGQKSLPTLLPEIVQKPLLVRALPKVYADPTQFASLAADPLAHEQKLEAALEILLTYQPDVLRNRLHDLLDDMTLNYTSLVPSIREIYEKEFPDLFNEQTNKMLFIDFMMNMYQQHYDNLYRIVVLYMGCEKNKYGLPLLPTHLSLYKKPSFYQNICKWVENENNTTYVKEPKNKFDLLLLKNRYHTVWRDSFAPVVKSLYDRASDLTNKLCQLATEEKGNIAKVVGKAVTDESLTTIESYFGPLVEIAVNAQITIKEGSPIHNALGLMIKFTNTFQKAIKTYYDVECKEITDQNNIDFIRSLETLWGTYEEPILDNLSHTTNLAKEFIDILRELKECVQRVNFKIHLMTSNEQMQDVYTSIDKEILPITDPKVINQYSETFFRWADSISRDEFNRLIIDIIKTKYAPSIKMLSTRKRATPVTQYLLNSTEKNANKLAYILSSGYEEEGALNTEIIRELTPIILLTNYIPSINSLNKNKERFEHNIHFLVKSLVGFAKQNQFTHLYSKPGIELLLKTLYEWIGKLESYKSEIIASRKNRLTKLIDDALKNYENSLCKNMIWGGGSSSRKSQICTCFSEENNKRALALTFIGGKDTSTSSQHIFLAIITEIKKDIEMNPLLKEMPGYNLINSFNPEENKVFYFEQIKKSSVTVEMSHELKKALVI